MRFGLLAGLTAAHGPRFRIGVCTVQKQDNGRDVQLKVSFGEISIRVLRTM